MPIKISLIADTASVIKGARDTERAFDDVADSLDDLARDAQRAGKTTGTSVKDGADKGTDAVDDLTKSFKTMANDANKQTKQAGDDIGDNIKRGTKEASEGTATLKENAGANAKEISASFDGSASSIADGFQGLAAEALEGFGPLGLAAGVALAAGAGIFKQQWQQSSEDTSEIMGDMFDDLLESETGYLSESYQRQQYYDILKGDSKVLSLKGLKNLARETGLTEEQVALAYSGNQDMMATATDRLIARKQVFLDQLEDDTQANDDAAKSGAAYIDGFIRQNQQRLDGIEDSIDATHRASAVYQEAGTAAAGSAARAGDEFDNLGRRIDAATTDKTISVSVDLTAAERELRNWHPVVEGTFRAGRAVV